LQNEANKSQKSSLSRRKYVAIHCRSFEITIFKTITGTAVFDIFKIKCKTFLTISAKASPSTNCYIHGKASLIESIFKRYRFKRNQHFFILERYRSGMLKNNDEASVDDQRFLVGKVKALIIQRQMGVLTLVDEHATVLCHHDLRGEEPGHHRHHLCHQNQDRNIIENSICIAAQSELLLGLNHFEPGLHEGLQGPIF
jgi:hypothetical protein